ncbi:MAG: hypothetical protein HFI89_16790 [Lachnospiraceae bacterium]|nr:hypothetical protein [Lachnospiraceae bacterium]
MLEEIAEELEDEVSSVELIDHAAKEFAPEYDPELAFAQFLREIEP